MVKCQYSYIHIWSIHVLVCQLKDLDLCPSMIFVKNQTFRGRNDHHSFAWAMSKLVLSAWHNKDLKNPFWHSAFHSICLQYRNISLALIVYSCTGLCMKAFSCVMSRQSDFMTCQCVQWVYSIKPWYPHQAFSIGIQKYFYPQLLSLYH